MNIVPIPKISDTTQDSEFDNIYTLPVGSIIFIDGHLYETVIERISQRVPTNKQFEVTPITPGTELFGLYGHNHLLITKNQ